MPRGRIVQRPFLNVDAAWSRELAGRGIIGIRYERKDVFSFKTDVAATTSLAIEQNPSHSVAHSGATGSSLLRPDSAQPAKTRVLKRLRRTPGSRVNVRHALHQLEKGPELERESGC